MSAPPPSPLLAGHESRAWFATLAPEKRAAIRALFPVRRSHNWIGLAFLALWAGGCVAVLRLPAWPARLAGYVVMGAALHALGILMHEAIHGNLFRHRRLDRWAAFLLGAPVLIGGSAYRVTHLLHHRHNRSERDPDEFGNYVRDPRLLPWVFYAWGVLGMLVFLVHVHVNALRLATERERAAVVTEYLLLLALYTGAAALVVRSGAGDLLVHGWLLPMCVAWLMVNLRGWSEHLLTRPGHPLTQTRTVTTNRIVRFFLCNLNYHLEHHLFPGIPWYNLPRVHALLQDEYRAAGACVYRSYLRFFRDALRAGVRGLEPVGQP